MPETIEELKKKIAKKMFQVCSMTFNVTNALSEENQNSVLSDLAEMQKCCNDAATAFKTMQTTHSPEQHTRQKSDVHTEHCCKICGCKYGDDLNDDDGLIGCSVVSGRKVQTYPCKDECRF